MNNFKLSEILLKIRSTNLSRLEQNYLIKLSFSISLSFIKAKYSKSIKFLETSFHSLDDLAMDSIVPLFILNSEGKIGIVKSMEKWNDSLDSEASANYFLSRIIWRRVDQTVTRLYKENDPVFDKILKTLNTCIKNEGFLKYRYFGTVLVLKDSNSEIFGEIISEDQFNIIPEKIFGHKQKQLFSKLFEYLVVNTSFYPAIPLNLLVKRIKAYHSITSDYNIELDNFLESKIIASGIIEDSLKLVYSKIENHYIASGKLTSNEADIIIESFKSIAIDVENGKINDSLFSYLKDKFPTLTKEMFYSKYHHVMNYLLNLFKNSIAQEIKST